jgi:chemotaxis protein MotB
MSATGTKKDAHGKAGGGGHNHGHEEHEEHEEHVNHEAWVIPYADMLTLLMALFIVLFATSIMDLEKFKQAATSLNQALGGEPLTGGVFASTGSSPIEGAPAPQKKTADSGSNTQEPGTGTNLPSQEMAQNILDQQQAVATARRMEADRMAAVQATIEAKANELGFAGAIDVRKESRGLVITVVTDQVLFDSGSAGLRSQGTVVLAQVAQAVRVVPNQIAIEGHTDSSPINTAQFPSNWELSTARATSVLRFMVDNGLNAGQTAAGGYADTRPLEDNGSAAGRQRNRRVEIVVLNENQNAVGSNQEPNPVAKGSGG